MFIREIERNDLSKLKELYLYLHENELLSDCYELSKLWDDIILDKNYHILVGIEDEHFVSSVTLVVIKNLTRDMRPYALVENVITHNDHRGKGYATRLISKAFEIASESGCYKVMLLTGSKKDSTLRFYENCGFNRNDKTGFIKWL